MGQQRWPILQYGHVHHGLADTPTRLAVTVMIVQTGHVTAIAVVTAADAGGWWRFRVLRFRFLLLHLH